LIYQDTSANGATGLWNHGGGGGGAITASNGTSATTYDMSVNRPTRSIGYSIDGNDGLAYTISGVKTYYAGGGGSGSDGYGGLGGLGGGGNGGHGLNGSILLNNGRQTNGIDGLANTGGGGGGGGGNQDNYGGAGGSGIVIASVTATKYGALSVPEGLVRIRWRLHRKPNGERMFAFTWEESGGPPPPPDAKTGFGRVLLRRLMGSAIGGEPVIEHLPDRLRYAFECPLERVGETVLNPASVRR
jgi:hypothetical protein